MIYMWPSPQPLNLCSRRDTAHGLRHSVSLCLSLSLSVSRTRTAPVATVSQSLAAVAARKRRTPSAHASWSTLSGSPEVATKPATLPPTRMGMQPPQN